MSEYERPFVPRGIPVDERRPATHDEIDECKRLAREGADALHSRASTADAKKPKLTDAESAARARKRLDQEGTR
jgi:hypothetical protein